MSTTMEPTYLFLDTEWADVIGSELVSLALVSADGQHRFYAERDPLPAKPTDFVSGVIYPLLERGSVALSDVAFTTALRTFLRGIANPFVLFDYANDGALLTYALAAFELTDVEAQSCGPIPPPVMTHMLREGLMTMVLEDWFEVNPAAQARRHHAAVDAEALRQAWLAVTGRIDASWSGTMMRAAHSDAHTAR